MKNYEEKTCFIANMVKINEKICEFYCFDAYFCIDKSIYLSAINITKNQ